MAKLPGAESVLIDDRKIVAYLLNRQHPLGGPKAAFFESFGFSAENWQVLRDAIVAHAQLQDVQESRASRHGQIYEVVGPLTSPDGRDPVVRVVWMIRSGEELPRLVTAVPS